MQSKRIYVDGAVIISMLLWGMSFVWTAVALRYYQPITVIFLRLIFSTLVLFIYLKIVGIKTHIKRTHFNLFLISALFNPFFYFLGENYGVKLTSPTISAVFIATIPLVAPIGAWLFLKEKMSRLNILGLIISFGGVLILLLKNDFSFEFPLAGAGALMFAVLSAVIYTIYLKKLSDYYNPFLIIDVQNLLGILYFAPLFGFLEIDDFIQIRPNVELISSILALAVFCSSLAFVAFTFAMREIGVGKTNVFANLIPVFTGIFSFFIIGEELSTQKIIGIVIVITGLFFSQKRQRVLIT